MGRSVNFITEIIGFGYALPMCEPRQNSRRKLVDSGLLVAEELVALPELPPSGHTGRRQLAITFAGAFEFQVGRSTTWIDASRILFAEADQSFVDRHVIPGAGHRSLILTPSDEAMDELWGNAREYFAARVRPCTLRAQMLVQQLRRTPHPLAAHEVCVMLLEESVMESRQVATIDVACVRRAKAVLQDCPEGRFTLSEIAAVVGVSPIYLTQAFKRSEGIPLYRYQTQLRLSRALAQLPERDDITDLAFELGFSSHSHFSAAFRKAYGRSPTGFRSGFAST